MPVEQETIPLLNEQLGKAIKGQAIWGKMDQFDPNDSNHRGQLRAILNEYIFHLTRKNIATDTNVAWGVQQLQKQMPEISVLGTVSALCDQFAAELEQYSPEELLQTSMKPEFYREEAEYWRKIEALS